MFEGTHHNLTQFLATLFKGNAIDYYNISFSIAVGEYSIVNTPSDLTWQHNTTYFNVTAHNCIGQSDSVTVYISNGMLKCEETCILCLRFLIILLVCTCILHVLGCVHSHIYYIQDIYDYYDCYINTFLIILQSLAGMIMKLIQKSKLEKSLCLL